MPKDMRALGGGMKRGLQAMIGIYTEMFDGLRSYYVGHENRRADAGFHATAGLSFICCVAIASAIPLFEYVTRRNIEWSVTLFGNKAALLLIGVAIGYMHVRFAKRTGRYHSLEPAVSARWKKYLSIYASGAALFLTAAMLLALLEARRRGHL
jgi:hypothetical protein